MIKEMRDLSWAKHLGGLENGPRGVWKGIRTGLKQVSRFLLVAALMLFVAISGRFLKL